MFFGSKHDPRVKKACFSELVYFKLVLSGFRTCWQTVQQPVAQPVLLGETEIGHYV